MIGFRRMNRDPGGVRTAAGAAADGPRFPMTG